MSSKAEVLPTPVSPRSRMVYEAFFFNVFMIPFLRNSTSLGRGSELSHQDCIHILVSRGVVLVMNVPLVFRASARRIVGRPVGGGLVTRRTPKSINTGHPRL